ncbi:Sulfotransferase family cytosolic 1B member 1 [Araneus ventricosus]|uniref:Sulfotransferase family cytosolic 1B member 1 n=1 Tax=Araneus ventricosus TaxID=182803 RepID=A0A4Y2WG13_ARAVE|nr:Sulfotransferase family cytosolic 1B member 1 [Araneus ventricosus]GBO35302.1 Sulfotransferase family cytosolic 1B member 1 [Araneus ventricosus]
MDYLPRDGDVIIASYPKTGTTWLQYIVLQITSKGQLFPSFKDVLEKVAPFMGMNGPEVIDNLTGLRVYKHHYRYDMVKKNPKAKVLYIYRNPADTVISLYHFIQGIWEQKIDLDEFFNGFLTGKIEFGRYFEHVLSFLDRKNDDNLLLISYEKLYDDPKDGILRIAKFLGEEYYRNLSEDESLLHKIVECTSFDYMKKNLTLELPHQTPRLPSSEKSKNTINFFRKGVVGDGKHSLSPDQLKVLREVATEVMKGSEVLQDWFNPL